MYYSNILTTTRGAVECGFQLYVSTNAATPSVVAGHGISVVFGLNALAAGPTSSLTVYWPERYGSSKITQIFFDYHSATTSQTAVFPNCLVVYTVPSTGPSYSIIQFVNPTPAPAGSLIVPAAGIMFGFIEAELGM